MSYALVHDPAGKIGQMVDTMAHETGNSLSRLFAAIEVFIQMDTDYSCCAAKNQKGDREVYLVPHRAFLAHLPDSATLIAVDHSKKQYELVEIFSDYGGPGEPHQWTEAVQLSREYV
jgi:hypothetical protein